MKTDKDFELEQQKDIFYMNKALELSKKAYEIDEIPIGCVIVLDDKIIGQGYNMRNSKKNTLHHAEIIAINEACESISDWRLEDCTMYVTVEPCAMCCGAILQGRVKRLVYGTKNKKGGCCGSILNILQDDRFNHIVDIKSGVLEDTCGHIMSDFFLKMRNKKQN